MKLKYLEAQNILSLGDVFLNLELDSLTLLDGWNYDDNTANAAGKTAILNSICFALYNRMPRKITASGILREGTKEGYAKVGIEINEDLLEVKRCKPNNTTYYKNGTQIDITQEEFESYIKLSYDQFLLIQYYPQESARLISLSDTEKKDFFLALMNYDFDSIKIKSDEKSKRITKEINALTLEKTSLIGSIEAYQEQVIDVESLKQEIASLDVEPHRVQLELLKNIEIPVSSKYDVIYDQLLEKRSEIKDLERQNQSTLERIKEIKTSINEIKSDATDSLSCPSCNTLITMDGTLLHDHELKKQNYIEKLTSKIEALNQKVYTKEYISNELLETDTLIAKCKNKREKLLLDARKHQREIDSIQILIDDNTNRINVLQSQIAQNSKLLNKIEKQNKQLSTLLHKISKLDHDLLISNTLASIFAPSGAASYILESIVDSFNESLKKYIDLIWPNASYYLSTFKENKNKEIKTKFSEKFIINNQERSIGALSGGEFKCLSLAMDFAILDIVESTLGVTVSPIILDEPFNNLDVSNRERVLEVLDQISRQRSIIVVDHASEAKTMFSQVIFVSKRNAISSIS